jgi:hypothetical protein
MPGGTTTISDVTGKSMLTRPPPRQAAFFPDLPMARVPQGFMRAETQLQRARRNRPKRQTFRRFAPMRLSDP